MQFFLRIENTNFHFLMACYVVLCYLCCVMLSMFKQCQNEMVSISVFDESNLVPDTKVNNHSVGVEISAPTILLEGSLKVSELYAASDICKGRRALPNEYEENTTHGEEKLESNMLWFSI